VNEPRPSFVRCSGPCGLDVAAHDAREAVLTWAKTASGEGGTTGAAAHLHTNVSVCHACFKKRINPRGPQPPERKLHAGDCASIAKRELGVLIPERQEISAGDGRARFRKAMEAIDEKKKETA
jgi:hypothetical protein